MRWRSRKSAAVLTGMLCATLTACGGVTVSVATLSSSPGAGRAATGASNTVAPDAGTIVQDARAAYRSAKSAHMHAMVQDAGGTEVIDIRGSMDGSNQELTIDDSVNGRASVRTVDGARYLKGDRDFWVKVMAADATTASLLTDKWVLVPADWSMAALDKLTIRDVLDGMLGPAAISASDTHRMRTYTATEQDTRLFVALAVDPSAQNIDTLKITAADPHNVTEVVGTANDGSDGTADFDGWNTQPRVTVPKGYITVPGSGGSAGPTV